MDEILKRDTTDKVIEILTLLSLLFAFYPLLFYSEMGDGYIMPIHFNAYGEADGWATKVLFWYIPIVPLSFYLVFLICERYYKYANIFLKVADEYLPMVYSLTVRFVRRIKLIIVVLFTYIANASFAIAMGRSSDLNRYVMMLILGVMLYTVVKYSIEIYIYKD